MRPSQRQPSELRTIRITRNFTRHAEGSVLIEMGDTRVLCTASVEESLPSFLRGRGLRVVVEMDKRMSGSFSRSMRTSVVFPAPDGAATM